MATKTKANLRPTAPVTYPEAALALLRGLTPGVFLTAKEIAARLREKGIPTPPGRIGAAQPLLAMLQEGLVVRGPRRTQKGTVWASSRGTTTTWAAGVPPKALRDRREVSQGVVDRLSEAARTKRAPEQTWEFHDEALAGAAEPSADQPAPPVEKVRWTAREDGRLMALLAKGLTYRQAAVRLGRTRRAVERRSLRLAKGADGTPAVVQPTLEERANDDLRRHGEYIDRAVRGILTNVQSKNLGEKLLADLARPDGTEISWSSGAAGASASIEVSFVIPQGVKVRPGEFPFIVAQELLRRGRLTEAQAAEMSGLSVPSVRAWAQPAVSA